MEEFAKEAPGKDAVTLFAPQEGLRFYWATLENGVLGEKYALLDAFFQGEDRQRGNAFLYRLLEYLRQGEDRLNLARCAYLLARLEPGESAAPAQKEAYRRFSQGFYRWALEPEGRRQLIAAVYLYVYLHRDTGAQ